MTIWSSSDLSISVTGGGGEAGGGEGPSSVADVDVDVGEEIRSARGSSRPSEPVVVARVSSFRETEMTQFQQRALKAAGATVVPVPAAETGERVMLDVKPGGHNELAEGGELSESQCRICHLGSDLETPEGSELILLGCNCRGELGTAHRHCSENWFRVKGDRICEICGAHARNIMGTGYATFMEAWNENRVYHFSYHRRHEERRCGDQLLCKLVLTFVIMAFILPWIIRANMK